VYSDGLSDNILARALMRTKDKLETSSKPVPSPRNNQNKNNNFNEKQSSISDG